MTILRIIHIFSAIFWVGTTLFMVFFVEPTVRALGADGGKFMQQLVGGTRFSLAMAASGWLTIGAGLLMYGPVTSWSWGIILGPRLALTLGAVAGIAAGVLGTAVPGTKYVHIGDIGRTDNLVEICRDASALVERVNRDGVRPDNACRSGAS